MLLLLRRAESQGQKASAPSSSYHNTNSQTLRGALSPKPRLGSQHLNARKASTPGPYLCAEGSKNSLMSTTRLAQVSRICRNNIRATLPTAELLGQNTSSRSSNPALQMLTQQWLLTAMNHLRSVTYSPTSSVQAVCEVKNWVATSRFSGVT